MRIKRKCDVLVVGAGPVGLFTALCLAERGDTVQIIDKDFRGSVHSYALALHPRSLRLLEKHGVLEDVLRSGHQVKRVAFYDGETRAATLDLSSLSGRFPCLLVVAQSALENAIEKRLKKRKVKVLWNHQAMAIEQADGSVTTRVARMEKFSMGYPVAHTEWMVTQETEVRSAFLVGADGYHSSIRKAMGAEFEHQGSAEVFSVFEFPARLEAPDEARVVFHDGTTNVLWPLDAKRGRWSFQVEQASPPPADLDSLRELVRARAPWFRCDVDEVYWATTALFERRLASNFGSGRIWLAGDASHITGPVGAQSMNVGLREGRDLADRMSTVLRGKDGANLLESYAAERRREWRRLLAADGAPRPSGAAEEWATRQAARILPCLPASSKDLDRLLGQLGLSPAEPRA